MPVDSPVMIAAWVLLLFFPACFSRHLHWLPSEASNLPQRCYAPNELPHNQLPRHLVSKAARAARSLPAALAASLEARNQTRTRRHQRHQGSRCPTLQLEDVHNADVPQRSLSPWTYRINLDENRHPQQLAFAECLCQGCIDMKSGRETSSLNSVLLYQKVLVLRRKPCTLKGDGQVTLGGFTFHTESIKVPVGCTCVLPQSS